MENEKKDYLDNLPEKQTVQICEFKDINDEYSCNNEDTKPYQIEGRTVYLCEQHKPKK